MLSSSFQKECLSMDDAQFLVAIALSFMGEAVAHQSVMNFLPLGNTTPQRYLPVVTEERKKVNALVSKSSNGVLRSLIEYLANNKVLEVKVTSGRMRSSLEKASLLELMHNKSIEQLYQKCMRLLVRYKPKEFICLYMKTEEYMAVFSGDMRKNYSRGANRYSVNVLSDSVISEILNSYYTFIRNYSTTGAYDTATCTPIAFLRNAFTWYKNSDDSDFYTILNSRGQDFDIGEDGATALDFAAVQDNKGSVSLDFVDVCSKINQASKLLFSHNGLPEAFYDIFSYHRDHKLNNFVTEFARVYKSRLGTGCRFEYIVEDIQENIGHRDSIISKKNGRVALCEVLEDIVDNGITRKTIFPVYQQLLDVTRQQLTKNGARLFRTEDSNPKHEESNGEMLRILIDGYVALRKLLLFLRSSNNTCGVTMNSFPVKIFRDARYLKRFGNLEDYIAYIADVSSLVEEVLADPARRAERVDGILDNDRVYDILARNSVEHNAKFDEWRSIPISYVPIAVQSMLKCDEDSNLHRELLVLMNYVDDSCVPADLNRDLQNATYAALAGRMLNLAKMICNTDVRDIAAFCNVHHSIEFFKILERMMQMEGCPICDVSGRYLLTAPSIQEQFEYFGDMIKDSNEQTAVVLKEIMLYRILALHKLLFAFTGVDKTQDYSGTYADLRNVFSVLEMFDKYLTLLRHVLNEMRFGVKDIYLSLAVAAQYQEIIELPCRINSWKELSFLYQQGARQFSIFDICTAEKCVVLNEERNRVLVWAMNNFLATFSLYRTIEKVNERTHLALSETGITKFNVEVEERLRKENTSLMTSLLSGDTATLRIRKILETIAEFDKMGYVQFRGSRLVLNSTYYHKSGYKVLVREGIAVTTTKAMTDNDLNAIRIKLSIG